MREPFAHIQGQMTAVATLQKAVTGERLHHAWIFHGPQGVGKMTTALAFAQWLLPATAPGSPGNASSDEAEGLGFQDGPDGTANPSSGGDEAVLRTGHPDVHVITKELARYSDDSTIRNRKLTTIPVEVLRQYLIEPVHRAASTAAQQAGMLLDVGGAKKVFIVDEAELLNEAGQNALLKTLEEPPPGTILVLVTSSEDKLLPTIRSRCQRVAFLPLHEGVVRAWVQDQVASREDVNLSSQMIDWVVGFAAGSLGRAKLALDWQLAEWAQVVLPAMARAAQGQPDGQLGAAMAERIDGFAKAWVDGHKNASKEAANKQAADLMLTLVANHARQQLHQLAPSLDAADPVAAENTLDPWLKTIDAADHVRQLMAANVNLGMACDYLGIAIAAAFEPAPGN